MAMLLKRLTHIFSQLRSHYEWLVLEKAPLALAGLALVTVFMLFAAKDFQLDASAETLVVEGDPDYRYFREITERYGSENFLVLTFTPNIPLFSQASLDVLLALRDEIRRIERVSSVVTVMDVPLLSNPPVPMSQLVSNIKSLEDPNVDVELAKKELANSPLYVNLLLNLNHNTTALQINFPPDPIHRLLVNQRQALLDAHKDRLLSYEDYSELRELNKQIRDRNQITADQFSDDIQKIRSIMDRFRPAGELHLGGVPMLAEDIMSYVKSDLMSFGIGVLIFLVGTLAIIFRKMRWVLLPMASCTLVVANMFGLLGLMHWQVTVISSNFISLLLILTLSMNIHLVVRYRELLSDKTIVYHIERVRLAVRQIFTPCLYMSLTTAVAFTSLIVSGIRPVINFGLMMTTGMVVAFIVTFIFFPSLLMLIGPEKDRPKKPKWSITHAVTRWFAGLSLRQGNLVLLVSTLAAALTIVGLNRLIVENAFIDYFDKDSEIYQGMSVIDQRLGGTTPLEVLIDFPNVGIATSEPKVDAEVEVNADESPVTEQDPFLAEEGDFVEEDFLMGMEDVGGFEEDFVEEDPEKYWFTTDKVEIIKRAHQYLETIPAVGKVISLATMIEIAERFNDGEPLDNIQLALLYSVIPEEFREIVIHPYVSVEHSQARISLRILDSTEDLQRNELLQKIEQDLTAKVGLEPERVHLSGMMVLYNNMLQSLFGSQISTLSLVFIGILIMFIVLFRSIKLAFIAMVPNVLAAGFVLGVLGWFKIPLDMMTITIASITIGIAVDDTVHYIVRFSREFELTGQYKKTVKRSHDSIGHAMYYTTITIIIGFSILMLSSFKPTIYFGFLTALAMLVALVLDLALLPRLLVLFKPFGPERKSSI